MNVIPVFSRCLIMKRISSVVFVIMLAVSVVACTSVNRLREAQDAFSRTAATENALHFDSNPTDAAANLGSMRSGYASALLSLEKIENDDEKILRRDGLWGTALTLKALCQWRLGKYPEALVTAGEAQQNAGDQSSPRDRAIVKALPGLIKTDQAYDKIVNNKPMQEVQDLLAGPTGAIADIQNARLMVEKDHPVQVYLIQAQLAAYRNFMVAQDRLNNHATIAGDDPVRKNANEQLAELNRMLKARQSGPAGQTIITYWVKLCALDMP